MSVPLSGQTAGAHSLIEVVVPFFHQVKCFSDQFLKNPVLSFKGQEAIAAVFRHTIVFDRYKFVCCSNARIK